MSDVWQIQPFAYNNAYTTNSYTMQMPIQWQNVQGIYGAGGSYVGVVQSAPELEEVDPITWLKFRVQETINGVNWPKAA